MTGIGRVYANMFSDRGASVVVNDLSGPNANGQRAADVVVAEIRAKGGKAVPNYDSVEFGDRIVQTAIDAFGRVDIVLNNAGILRDTTFARMTDGDWDLVHAVHMRGSYKVAKAAWPHMQKQKYGRILNTASAAGIYGNYGQANYSAGILFFSFFFLFLAKLALHGFSMTLAREGAKYNIHANTIAPLAASRMTETVLPPEILKNLKPEFVAPFVMYLCHESTRETGGLFEVGAGFAAKLRWERTKGAIFKADETFTPGSVAAKWNQINDFNGANHPLSIMDVDWMAVLEQAKHLPPNPKGPDMRFDGKVVLVTGAGGGLGRAYALLFARLGASVVVNDLGTSTSGQGQSRAADEVVAEIKNMGGKAVANYDSVEEGEKLVDTAIKAFGRIDVIVNNAGILRDKSFSRMTDGDWDLVHRVHLRGSYKVAKAAWPHFLKQKYGRIINTASAVGLYGNFGQANYSAAKLGIVGFSNTLAIEGAKKNILVNSIAPNAGTRMTATVMPPEMVEALKPDYVAPLVAYLAHESNQTTGGVFEVGSGWVARVRWQRTGGVGFPIDNALLPEQISARFGEICNFEDGRATYPKSTQESLQAVFENFSNTAGKGAAAGGSASSSSAGKDPKMEQAKKRTFPTQEFHYTDRDTILYNLSIGATRKDLNLSYENSDNFCVVPSFGVIPAFPLMFNFPMQDIIGQFNPMMLLHGEQYLEIKKPIPTSGTLVNEVKVVDVLDKGKGVVLILGVTSKDTSGNVVCYNEYSNFIRGVSGVGNKKAVDRGAATAANVPPKRAPDAVVKEKTTPDQAAIYRLNGDRNPLHIDPDMAKMGGFDVPILHGLCTFGIATKHVFQKYANADPAKIKSVKARFAKHVFPGETLQTEMWKSDDGRKIFFQVRVLERDVLAITNAAVELTSPVAGAATKASAAPAAAGSGAPALKAMEGFKASPLFQQLAASMSARSAADRQAQVKKVNAIFQFNLTSGEKTASWFIDLKNGQGSIGTGAAAKPDCVISMSDANFVDLAMGKLSGQKAFMAGKLKIKGQMMLATKLDGVLKDAMAKAKM